MALGKISGGNYLSLGYNVKPSFCKMMDDVISTVVDGGILISWLNIEDPVQPIEISYRYSSAAPWTVYTTYTGDSFFIPDSDFFGPIRIRLRTKCASDIFSFPAYIDHDIPLGVGNTLRQQSFQRNNCTVGYSGTYYNYQVLPDTYFGVDLAAANALADADIAANGQDQANIHGSCIADSVISILVIDVYDDPNLDVCLYINTPGVAESNNIVATALKTGGQNFYLTTDPANSAYMLASDLISDVTLKWRVQANIGKLIVQYPDDVAIPEFIFELRGRSTVSGAQNGQYALKNPTQTMGMLNSPGTYIPVVTPGGGPTPIIWNGTAPSGADGTVGVGIGSVIRTFTYLRTGGPGVENTIVVS